MPGQQKDPAAEGVGCAQMFESGDVEVAGLHRGVPVAVDAHHLHPHDAEMAETVAYRQVQFGCAHLRKGELQIAGRQTAAADQQHPRKVA